MYTLQHDKDGDHITYESNDAVDFINYICKLYYNNISCQIKNNDEYIFYSNQTFVGDLRYQLIYDTRLNKLICRIWLFSSAKSVNIDVKRLKTAQSPVSSVVFYIQYDDNKYIFTNEQELILLLQTIVFKSTYDKVADIPF